MEWLDRILKSQAKHQIASYIGKPGSEVLPNEFYLTIDLASIWIPHVRKGLSKFYGAMHGSIIVPHETGEIREYQVFNPIADAKELDARHFDRIIQGPYRLLNSVPYRGAGIHLRISLLSIKSADLAAPYMELLKSISDVAGVSFTSQASSLVNVIHAGISAIAGDDSLEIGRYGLFEPVFEGYYAVVGADPGALSTERLKFDEQSRILRADDSAIDNYPYFVIKFSASTERIYWQDIPDIRDSYKKMISQFRISPNDIEKNLQAFDAFQVTVELSPDLLSHHAQKLVEYVRQKFSRYITEARRGAAETEDILNLTLTDFNPFY